MDNEVVEKKVIGMPVMSVVFDSVLTIAVIGAAITIGQISAEVRTNSENMVRVQAQIAVMSAKDSSQDISIAETKTQYLDIIRRLESIDRKLEK